MAKSSDKNKIASKATNAKAHDKTMGKPKAVKKTTAQHGSRFAKTGVSHFRLLKIFAALMVAGVLVLWLLLWQGLWRDIPMQSRSQMLNIKQGQTYTGLINELGDKGQIRFPLVAKIYQRLFIHDSLKAGVFEIEQGTNVQELLQLLSNGKLAQMNRISVIEGTTFNQLRKRLAQDPMVTHSLTGLDNAQLMQKLGIPHGHPEGWFAPNTYYFAKGETDANILKHLYKAQQKIVDAAWQQRALDLPYKNAYEALIMASIVEKETGIASEREEVAGVFVRRLKIGMRLQTDPTVIYGMGDNYTGNIRRADLLNPTPYNTYTINGLPPTPIALPSKASIEAALHPAAGKAIYFVATGKGGHVFSDSLEQHNQAVAQYLRTLRDKRAQSALPANAQPSSAGVS